MFKKYLKLFEANEFSTAIYNSFDDQQWIEFLTCYERIFNRKFDQIEFQWYFEKDNYFTILRNNEKKSIGMYGLLNIKLNINQTLIHSYLCHNVGIVSEYGGKGLFQYIGDQAISNIVSKNEIVLGFPNKISRKGHLRLGWEQIGNVRFIAFDGDITYQKPSSYTFTSIDEFDENDDELFTSFSQKFSLSLNKNIKYLNWRIGKPKKDYSLFLIHKNGVVKGYCIYKKFVDKQKNKLHLVDYLFEDVETLHEIIRFSIEKKSKEGFDILDTWMVENTVYEKIFFNFGFSVEEGMPDYPIILFQKGDNVKFDLIDNEKIFFTLFDNDVF